MTLRIVGEGEKIQLMLGERTFCFVNDVVQLSICIRCHGNVGGTDPSNVLYYCSCTKFRCIFFLEELPYGPVVILIVLEALP